MIMDIEDEFVTLPAVFSRLIVERWETVVGPHANWDFASTE